MKSLFLDTLDARDMGDDTVMLLSPFRYQSKLLNRIIIVPQGFVTDFESISRWLPIVYAFAKGYAKKAATIHDWLYQRHEVSKRRADLVFLEAMKAQHPPVSYIRREMMYAGVMVGGWTSYASGPDRYKVLQTLSQ